jgi:hypothetical protein
MKFSSSKQTDEQPQEEEMSSWLRIKGMVLFSSAIAIYSIASLLVKMSMERYSLTP